MNTEGKMVEDWEEKIGSSGK